MNLPKKSLGLLNDNNFYYKSLDVKNSVNTFPASIQVVANILGFSFNITLNQVQGVLNDTSLNTRLFVTANGTSGITQGVSKNIVCIKKFKLV